MRRRCHLLGWMVSVLVLSGCATHSPSPKPEPAPSSGTQQPVKLDLKDERILQGPACSVDDPAVCPEGTTCASLDLTSGRRMLCVEPQAVCEQLSCATGQCVILESYPIQVRCAQ